MRLNIVNNLVLAALAIAASSPVLALEAGKDTAVAKVPGGCPEMRGGACMDKGLGLTDDQLEKLYALKKQYSSADAPKALELRTLRDQEFDLLSQPAVDKQRVLDVQAKINILKGDLANSRVSYMADASAVFTPEQKAKMRHLMLTRKVMGGGFHHRRHHGFEHGKSGSIGQVEGSMKTAEVVNSDRASACSARDLKAVPGAKS